MHRHTIGRISFGVGEGGMDWSERKQGSGPFARELLSSTFYLDYDIYKRDLSSFGNFVPLNLDSIKHIKHQTHIACTVMSLCQFVT